MTQSANDVLKDLKANQYAPVYFLHGEEPYQIDKIADYIEKHSLTATEKGFNLTVIYGKDSSIKIVLESARKFPVMAQKQVIIVKEAQELQGLNKKEEQAHLAAYCQKPVPSTVLVIAYKHKKIDARTALYKVLKKQAVLVETKKLYDNQIPDWINNYCKENGHSIRPKASVLLSEYIGNNISRITKEIDKIFINFKRKIEITEPIIEEYIGISKEFNVFELQNAFGKKEVLKVNQIINYFESNPKNNPVIPVIALLFSYFTKILLVHCNKGKDTRTLAGLLKVNPYFIKDYLEASRSFSLMKILTIISYIHKADLHSKGVESVAGDYAILKVLAFKILH